MDDVSWSVCPLELVRNHEGQKIGSALGTGFLWAHNEKIYLITNWHNVTGIDPYTNKLLSDFIPNQLCVRLFKSTKHKGKDAVYSNPYFCDLYENGVPTWYEHKDGRKVDCVALHLEYDDIQNVVSRALNETKFQTKLNPYIGMDCYVVGYPKGLYGQGRTAIWKRGSIATEPEFDHLGEPLFLIDTATRKGMSGSPVIGQHSGVWGIKDGKLQDDSLFGTCRNLIGIYSGRVGDDELGVQLGRVWKSKVIEEILELQKKGTNPH